MPDRYQGRQLDPGIAVLLAGVALGLYLRTLAPTVLAGDGGEFQFAPYLLGIAHPTGYPLYSLLGWAWSHLIPIGDAAYRMNLFSAAWAAATIGVFYLLVRIFLSQTTLALPSTLSRTVSALAALFLAVTPTFWSQAIIAEVYSLHAFFCVLLLYLLLIGAERREKGLLLAAIGCFGLSLSHHRTALLLAPALLIYLWSTDRSVYRDRSWLVRALALLFSPWLLYLYLPWRAPHTPYLRLPLTESQELVLYENTLAGWADFVLGGPFGGSVDFSVDLGERLMMAGSLVQAEVGWAGIFLAMVGVLYLVFGRPATRSRSDLPSGSLANRWALLGLTGLVYVVTVGFNLIYTIGDIFVLFIPSYLVMVLWMAVGMSVLVHRIHRRRLTTGLLVVAFLILILGKTYVHYAELDQSHRTEVRKWWETILSEPLPPEAILISNDRNEIMPMWYLQYVEDRRPDLLGLFPLITPEYPVLGSIFDLALGTGRPVYLMKQMPGVEIKVEIRGEGELVRVLGLAGSREPDHPRQDRIADCVELAGYNLLPSRPHPGEELRLSLYWEALCPLEATYHTFVHLVDAGGQKIAQSDRQPGGVYYPTSQWRPGERLRDEHRLAIPRETPPGLYQWLVGMYALTDTGELEPLGEPVLIGQIEVQGADRTEP